MGLLENLFKALRRIPYVWFYHTVKLQKTFIFKVMCFETTVNVNFEKKSQSNRTLSQLLNNAPV